MKESAKHETKEFFEPRGLAVKDYKKAFNHYLLFVIITLALLILIVCSFVQDYAVHAHLANIYARCLTMLHDKTVDTALATCNKLVIG